MQARRNREEWARIIETFERSGQSHEAFCLARGLQVGTFRVWLYRLRARTAPSTAISLLPVEVTTAVAAPVPSEVVVAVAGVEIRVAVGVDVRYIAGLVAELRSQC